MLTFEELSDVFLLLAVFKGFRYFLELIPPLFKGVNTPGLEVLIGLKLRAVSIFDSSHEVICLLWFKYSNKLECLYWFFSILFLKFIVRFLLNFVLWELIIDLK